MTNTYHHESVFFCSVARAPTAMPTPMCLPAPTLPMPVRHTHPFSHTSAMHDLASLSLPAKQFRRAERLSGFRWELVLDGEALPDR